MSGLRVELINPFISAVDQTFDMMVGCKVKRAAPSLKANPQALYPVSGIIGLTGVGVSGTVVLTMSTELALKSASAMLMMEYTAIDGDVLDAVGEITNMIAGQAKAQLEEYKLSLSLPNVIEGANTMIHFPDKSQPITIPFSTDWGPLAVEVGLSGPQL